MILTFVLAAKELIVLFDTDNAGFDLTHGRLTPHREYTLILSIAAIAGLTVLAITTLFMRKPYFRPKKSRRNLLASFTIARDVTYTAGLETTLPLAYRLWLTGVFVKTSANVYLKKYSKLIIFTILGIAVLLSLIGLFRLL